MMMMMMMMMVLPLLVVVLVDEEPGLVGEAEPTHSTVTSPPGHCRADSRGHGVMDCNYQPAGATVATALPWSLANKTSHVPVFSGAAMITHGWMNGRLAPWEFNMVDPC